MGMFNTLFSICMHVWDWFWVLHVGAFQDKSGIRSWTPNPCEFYNLLTKQMCKRGKGSLNIITASVCIKNTQCLR